jgi:hypothetical protein
VNLVIDGKTAILTPLRDGQDTFAYYNMTFALSHVYERARAYDDDLGEYYCDWGSSPEDVAIQTFSVEDFDCTVSSFVTHPHVDITLEQIDINFTHPSYPDWYIVSSWYASSGTFEISPSTNNTYVHPSQNYTWKFDPSKIKFSYLVHGFPFVGDGSLETGSFVQFYWDWTISVVDTSVAFVDDTFEFRAIMEHEGSTTLINFDKGFLFDGVAYLQPDLTKLGPYLNFSKNTFTFPLKTGIPLCVPGHYTELIYDPAISSLFTPPVASEKGQDPKNSKTTIILGAVLGSLAAVIVIGIIAAAIFVPSVREFFRPFSKPRDPTTTGRDTSSHTQTSTQGWARSTTPSQP